MLLSTEFLFALFVSFIGTGARCRLGFSRRVDAASYQTASLRAKVGTQSSEHGVIATSEHEQSSGGFRVEGHVRLLCGPDAMEKNSELACHRDYRSVLGLLASSFSQMKPPSPEGRVLSLRSQDMVRALDQETSQINVACFSNAELRIAIARLAASWSQAQIAASVPTSLESFLVPQGQNIGQRGNVADALNLQQSLRLGVLRLREFEDLPIVLLDLESHLRDLLEHRIERFARVLAA
jgi:hypothetical protein